MKSKNKELLLGVLLGAGLNVLSSLRERLPDNLDDIKARAMDTYATASDRVSRASDVLRGEDDSHILGNVGALLMGVGVGVGIGLLIAPARGDDTRAKLTEKVSSLGDKVLEHAEKKPASGTGTYGG
ncbi:MAG: YtxH domain-containing protein [Terriglobales bacterium]